MPPRKQDTILVACPHCGHRQAEPRAVFSTYCRECGRHLRVQEFPRPAPAAPGPAPDRRRITCFDCGTVLEVAASAESTMCKRCSRYIDLKDYRISSAVSKNFKTKGAFVIETKGYVFNTEAIVGDAIIKGRFLGRLIAERSLTVFSTAEIKGAFQAQHLIVPAANHFRWREPINVGSAEIAGELAGALCATGAIVLKSTARLFGCLEAADLVVEDGAVVVGNARVGARPGR
jgi:cytoskeletal protein CcmA (bactofilin family)